MLVSHAKLQEIMNTLGDMRAEFDQKLEDALNREDNLILDCGCAEGYMEETVWAE